MAQKSVPTVLKKQGRRNVIYRDVDGKTYSGIVTTRTSATVATLKVYMGATKVTKSGVNLASSGTKQTNVFYFRTGH
jgi:hypothetical protein